MSDLATKIDLAKQSKALYERRWDICLRFLNGEQHPGYDSVTQAYGSGARGSVGQRRLVINLIQPIYKNLLSRLATNYPGIAVMPASPSSASVVQAQMSEVYLRYVWHQRKVDRVFRRLVEHLLSLGTGALHVCWEPGETTPTIKAVSAFDLFWDSGALNYADSDWIAVRKWATRDEVSRAYPDFADKLSVDMDEAFNSSSSIIPSQLFYSDTQRAPDAVEVFDIYRNGKHTVMCEGITLYEGPTPQGVTPVHVALWTEIPNVAWGQGLVEPLVDLQRIYNAGREMVMQNAALMANPKWLIPKEAGIAANALTSRPGEKVYFAAGFQPEQRAGTPIPSYVIDNNRQVAAEMQDVSGIHSATLGRQTKGGLSGVAIRSITENDLSSIQVSQDYIESAAQSAAESILAYAKEYIPERVMVRQLGSLGRAVFREVSRDDLVDNPQVFIEAGTLFQDSIEDREARVVAQFQAGLIDKDTAVQELSFRTGNGYLLRRMEQVSHAREMLDVVLSGGAIELLPTDDPSIFTEVFDEFVRSADFYQQPPERQAYITDLLRMWKSPDPFGAFTPQSTDDAAQALGLAESPITQAQVAAGALTAAGRQADANLIEQEVSPPTNEFVPADGSVLGGV